MNAKSAAINPSSKPQWNDPDDAPELGDDFFQKADLFEGKKLLSRGRPAGSGSKVSTTIRFDAEVLDAFKAAGDGWQTRMNDALKDWLKTHRVA